MIKDSHPFTAEAVAEATIAELVAEQSAAGDDVATLPDTPSHGEGDAADNGRDLWNKLAAVDVAAAERLHPNQRRKIKRALEIFHTHGVKASDVAARQAERERVLLVDPCVVWVHSEWGPLAERLDTRVDRMMAAGLLDEVRAFREALDNAPREVVEGNRGVLQAIGFKEFDPYFEAIKTGGEEGESVDADVVLAACVDKLKRATRKYARKQLTWIRNAFVRRGVSVFRVDSTDPSTWDDAVLGPALATVARFLDGHGAVSNVDLGADGDDASDALNRNKFIRCETCCRDLQGQRQWEVHIRYQLWWLQLLLLFYVVVVFFFVCLFVCCVYSCRRCLTLAPPAISFRINTNLHTAHFQTASKVTQAPARSKSETKTADSSGPPAESRRSRDDQR